MVILSLLVGLALASIVPGAQSFLGFWHRLSPVRVVSPTAAASRTGTKLFMIDNFFRLHEKNRKLNFDELFQKARYDFPQAFGSGAASFEGSVPVEAAVKQALKQALTQLPACAGLDLAIVSITTTDDSDANLGAALKQLSASLPGNTRVIGWAKPKGSAVASSIEEAGAKNVAFGQAGGIQVTLASITAVNFFPFFASEDQVLSWGVEPVTGLWEKLIGLSLNQAYKDPPVFFMFGRVDNAFSVDLVLEGIDSVYPGTAKVGGAVIGEAESKHVRLFSRLPGLDGAAILVEENPGVMGLALSGDIRALVYATQGLPSQEGDGPRYVIESVSKDGRKILSLKEAGTEAIKAAAEVAGSVDQHLMLGLGGPEKASSKKDEGADRWSFVSVRGSSQEAVRIEAGKWQVDGGGGITLPRVVKPGQVVWWSAAKHDGELAIDPLIKELRDEIDNEWKKSELGVMKFRPSGVLLVKDPARAPLSSDSLGKLSDAVPTTFVGGLEAPGQLAPWDLETRAALVEGSVVMNVFACKAKRRDPRELRFDYRRPWVNTGLGSTDYVLDQCFDPLQYNSETGELEINRKAALIGTDVRVENMAWNVREESVVPTGLWETLVWSKERELQFVREDAPLLNLMRTVMTLVKSNDPEVQAQARGRDVRAALAQGGEWSVVGEVMKGSPLDGIMLPVYDPIAVSRGLMEDEGASALSIHVDQTYYGGKLQDLTDVRLAFDVPVIADDLILYPYQTYLFKMFKADGVRLSLQVLTAEDLLYQVKICASLFITPIMVVSSLHQLRAALALLANTTGAILSIDNTDPVTMKPREGSMHVAAQWLADSEVQTNLKAAADEPFILVEGTRGRRLSGEERDALRALGVRGQFLSNVSE